ncbi:sulfurtransferase-like selenium metabolism protein YedF [Facklamia sp. 7083-14-GEN3]|uniref:sulfurtransferase-like selenium metabolism protein YedF n=1 Tax=Facklamia sp. 7083-14-GEN3 TaxID=2973478 RepID=UPI00215C3C0A|nr:sulfurtransferase-like selenium metabolism protein YedF [Facklamia sp. 7083-14-GEN3]MCR8968593.1 sulfurtransferase-like selenium metabolism protein YedF [Facklamia sp. 7083-14-GEN3]
MTDYIVVIASDKLGEGNNDLGRTLMKSFVSVLAQEEELPKEILLYNGGVTLAAEGADTVEDLQTLLDKGVAVKACGTCVSFYELKDKLAVGEETNMRYILEQLRSYDRVVRP